MANNTYQDQITLVNTNLIGISDRLSNPSQFHPMVRNDWGTQDKLRGLLGKYYTPIYPTNPNLPEVQLLNYKDLYSNPMQYFLVKDENQDVLLVQQAAGSNQGTNLIFDAYIDTIDDTTGDIVLNYSPSGWDSPGYNITYPPAEYYFGGVDNTDQETFPIIAQNLSRYMGITADAVPHARIGADPTTVVDAVVQGHPFIPGTPISGILSGSQVFIDYTMQLHTPSANAQVREKAEGRLTIESVYVQYVESVPSFEDVIKPDNIPEDLIPNAYYLQLEMQNTGTLPLALGRYARAITLDGRVDWFNGSFNQLTENNRKRYYDEYAKGLSSATLTPGGIDSVRTVLATGKDTFVLHVDKDILREDSINPSQIPFYNKIVIPTAPPEGYKSEISLLGNIVAQASQDSNNLVDLLQYSAIQGLQGPVLGIPLTTNTKIAGTTAAAATYSLQEQNYAAVFNVGDQILYFKDQVPPAHTPPGDPSVIPPAGTPIPENSAAIAGLIESDSAVGLNQATSLHKRGLNQPTQGIEIDQSTAACASLTTWSSYVTRTLGEIWNGEFCHTETLMFVVKKYRVGDTGETLVQTYYFTNRFDGQDIVYYDSQVKSKQKYRYDIEKVVIVFGSKYEYTSPSPAPAGSTLFNRVFHPPGDTSISTEAVYQAKLPFVVTPSYMQALLMPHVIGGIQVTIEDKPPVAPEVSFYSFIGINNRLKILLQPSTGMLDEKPVVIQPSDNDFFRSVYEAQTGIEAPVAEIDKIEFRSDDPVDSYQIFKINRKPTSYKDFAGNMIFVDPTSGRAGSYDDIITPNTKYYYCARSVDINGNISNPTHIFEIEMVDNGGQIYLKQEIFMFESATPEYTQTGRRFVYIEPGLQQLALAEGQNIGAVNVNNSPNSSILGATGVTKVWGETFKIRVSSKKTGRKLDLNLTFKNTGIVNPSE